MAKQIKYLRYLFSIVLIGNSSLLMAQEAIQWQRIGHISDSIFNRYIIEGERLNYGGENLGIEGGVISIVQGDSTIFSKGYGLANLEQGQEFHPQNTKVMIASVAKLVTMTAVLKLVESGGIDLERPIESYLSKLKLKNRFDQTVLVKHLLTHQAGFDDNSIGSLVNAKSEIIPLEKYVLDHVPTTVWKPGHFYNYSNYGFTLLAYLVQEVSGMPFEQYANQEVLGPLGMADSGFGYNESLLDNIMTRYRWVEDGNGWFLRAYDIKYTNRPGASGFKTTASDMSKFMKMWLTGEDGLLGSEIKSEALSPQFKYDNNMPIKIGWAWNLKNRAGLAYADHSGDDTGMASYLMIVPESEIGIFVAFNNTDGISVHRKLINSILDVLLPIDGTPAVESANGSFDIEDVSGTYQYTNDSHTTMERVSYLFGDSPARVESIDGQTISINGTSYSLIGNNFFSDMERSFVKFLNVDGNNYYSTGRATYVKLKWYQIPGFHMTILMACGGIFITMLIWPIRWLVLLIRKKDRSSSYNLKWLSAVPGLLLVLFFVLLGTLGTGMNPAYGVPSWFQMLFIMPLLAIVIALYSMFSWIGAIRKARPKLLLNLHLGLVHTAVIALLLVLNFYNLIGFNFG